MLDIFSTLNECTTLGIKIIDDEHRLIITLFNDLIVASRGGKSKVDHFIKMFINEFAYHAEDEEHLMEKIKYPGLDYHKEQHRHLLLRFEEIHRKIMTDEEPVETVIHLYLLFMGHLLVSDIKIAEHYHHTRI